MKQRIFGMLLSMTACTVSHAELHRDGFDEIHTRDSYIPRFTIESGNQNNASDFLYNAVCKDGQIGAPQHVIDLHGFVEGHPAAGVISREHYLVTSSNSIPVSSRPGDTRLAELEFNSPTTANSTIDISPTWFTAEGMLASTCLARAPQEMDRVHS